MITRTIPVAMRALQQPSLTGPRHLRRLITDPPVPAPAPDEVLIRVTAAGVSFADVMQTHGIYDRSSAAEPRYDGGPQAPDIAGFEAGEIVALGSDVIAFEFGAYVIGTGYGACAEFVVIDRPRGDSSSFGWRVEQAFGLVINWADPLARSSTGPTPTVRSSPTQDAPRATNASLTVP